MSDINPRDLLKRVIDIIERDVSEIENLSDEGKLDPNSAMDLTRYSKALLDIISDADELRKKQRKALADLSDEDLEALAEKALAEKKAKKAKPDEQRDSATD